MNNHICELAALVTAVSWTIGAMIFEGVTRRAGVMAVNTIKVFFGSLYLAILAFFTVGQIFPTQLGLHTWLLMSASGLVGFVIGDYFLFTAYQLIGSRMGMLLMSASVPLTAIAGFFIYGETLGNWALLGMVATMGGIILTVMAGGHQRRQAVVDPESKAHHPSAADYRQGVIFGLCSAVAMAGATLLTKAGATGVEPIAATQIRILAGKCRN